MDMQLKGKRALVLASSSGLGKAVALDLAREGAAVAVCSRSLERAEAAAADIRAETGAEVFAFEADVAVAADIERLVAAAVEALGGLDLDRKSTRLNSSHVAISYAVFCLKKK